MKSSVTKAALLSTMCAVVAFIGSAEFINSQTTISDYTCIKDVCSKRTGTDANCPGDHICNLSMASGSVIFCHEFKSQICVLENPTDTNDCTGYCEDEPTRGCYVSWTICKDPTQQ